VKIILRTILMILPMAFIICSSVVQLISVAIRNTVLSVFKLESYWTLENEWFQVKNDLERWYLIWLHGFNQDDS
jgi:hypothetical protein